MKNLKKYYVYVLCDPRKKGKYIYGDLILDYEPFYIGKGTGNRSVDSIHSYRGNPFKERKVNNLENINALEKEKEFIKIIGYNKNGPLTNLTDGGMGGSTFKNRRHTEESKLKMSSTRIEKGYSKGVNNPMYGKCRAGEHTGEKNPMYNSGKTVVQYSLDNKLINVWRCAHEAGITLNIPAANIRKCCAGTINTAGKYIWNYA